MKPNITFILHLPPPIHGASMVGSFIRQSALINDQFSTRFINLATNTTLEQSGKGSFKKGLTFIKIVSSIVRSLLTGKADVYYITLTASGSAFYKDLIVVALIKLFGKRIVYHFHNKGVAEAGKKALNDRLYRFAFRHTKSILLSPYLYPDIERYVAPEDIYYCPLGIQPFEAVEAAHSEAGAPRRILFLSNMMVEKGVFVLLDALKIVKDKGVPFQCDFVGAWSDITEDVFVRAVGERGLTGSVVAHGAKYNADKLSFFQHADLFVFPTYYKNETFGLVNLEAMQHALPIIATPEGGIPEVVIDGETGFLVPQQNAPALAAKIDQLIRNPDLRVRMGRAGKKRFDERFTIAQFERNMARILQDVAAPITKP